MSYPLTIHDWLDEVRGQGEILDRARAHPPQTNGIHGMAPHASKYAEARQAILYWMENGELPRWAQTT